ncbi:MAG: sulfite exporter TauE/SafE family protein [Rickettsiales bacterium]
MQKENKLLKKFQNLFTALLVFAIVAIITYLFSKTGKEFNKKDFLNGITIGIIAQTIDGAIGMAYGVTATTFMLSQGFSPAIASSSVHIAEIFTTGASGLSHWRLNNINKKLFLSLVFPGIIGGLIGVLILTNIDGKTIKPLISVYLIIMGIYIIAKSVKKNLFEDKKVNIKKTSALALTGGALDAIGGGGWGPVVTTTLISSGHEPKKVIGSVNSSEFFVTLFTGFSFAIFIGVVHPELIAGLVLGGVGIAPISAKITTKLPAKLIMIIVGILIISLSLINLLKI